MKRWWNSYSWAEEDGSVDKYVHNQKRDWYNQAIKDSKAAIRRVLG